MLGRRTREHFATLGSLSTRVFETRTASGSELFSLLTCLFTTIFTLLSIFYPLEMISIKIWETPLSWHAKCSLPVAVRVSKTRVLKLPTYCNPRASNVIGAFLSISGRGEFPSESFRVVFVLKGKAFSSQHLQSLWLLVN